MKALSLRAAFFAAVACFVVAIFAGAGSPPAQAFSPNTAAAVADVFDSADSLVTKVVSCRRCAELQCQGYRIACAPGCRCSDIRGGGGGGGGVSPSCRACAAKQCAGQRIGCPRGCTCRDVFSRRR